MSRTGYVLQTARGEGAQRDLLSPTVGVFAPAVAVGDSVSAGQVIGTIEVLGVQRNLRVSEGLTGLVTGRAGTGLARVPVQYGDVLLTVSKGSTADRSVSVPAPSDVTGSDLCFVAPMSGRFYSRPSPTETPFVVAGDVVQQGQTIGLLEVMKTFNRLVYQDESLPERAMIERIVPDDGDDVVRGDVILALRVLAEK